MPSKSRLTLALRRSDARARAREGFPQERETLGFYRLPDGAAVHFNSVDLQNDESLRNAFVQAVIMAEHEGRNAVWN